MASVDQPVTSTISTTTTAPAVTITPASPTNTLPSTIPTPLQPSTATIPNHEMKEKTPTDSETALLANKTTAGPSTETKPTQSESPLSTLTRKLSGKGTSKSNPTNKAEKSTTSTTAPTPIASTSRSTPSTLASKTTATGTTTGTNVAGKKKKKRKGLAGIFAALGCLSVYEMEDEPTKSNSGATRDMTQKAGNTVTKPVTTTAAVTGDKASTPIVKPSTDGQAVGASTVTQEDAAAPTSIPQDDVSKGQQDSTGPLIQDKEAIVLAPTEPVLPIDETAGVTSGAVQPPGSGSELLSTPNRPGVLRRESDNTPVQQPQQALPSSSADATSTSGGYTDLADSEVRSGDEHAAATQEEQDYGMEEEYEDEEDRLIAQGGMGIPLDENGHPAPLLPVMDKIHQGRKCLVLDLDETLLHSSFKMLPSADYIVPVEIESQVHNVYVIKRPGVDHFLTEMGKIYEVVVFTASLSKYADPVLDMLDPAGVVRHRLFRESCYNHKGNYVKDLSQLGRDMEGCIIIDNSPASYIFHPNNAVPVSTWFNDPHDTELTDLCPFLTDLATVDDIRGVLDGSI